MSNNLDYSANLKLRDKASQAAARASKAFKRLGLSIGQSTAELAELKNARKSLTSLQAAEKRLESIGEQSAESADQLQALQKQLKASQGIKQTGLDLKEAQGAQRALDTLQKLNRQIGTTSQKSQAAQARVKTLWQQFNQAKAAGASTAKISEAIAKAKRRADQLGESHANLTSRARESRQSLAAAGVDTRQLGQAQNALREKVDRLSASLATQKTAHDKAWKKSKSPAQLQRQIDATRKKIDRLNKSQATQADRAKDARDALGEAGINAATLAEAEEQLARKTDRVNRRLDRQKQLLSNAAVQAKKLRRDLARLRTVSVYGGTAALAGGVAAAVPTVRNAAQFEDYEAVLHTIEGSEAAAKKSMRWVSDFAAKTPYQLAEVNESFVRLRAYGLDPTSGLMRTLGDTSAAMGKPMIDAVEAIADAVTGENERLKEFGIRGSVDGDLVSYEYTDKNGNQKTLQALKNDRKQIEKLLSRIWNEKYAGAMERRSKTLTGLYSNMADQITRFQVMVMDSGPFEMIKKRLASTLAGVNAMAESGELQQWANDVGEKISTTLTVLGELASTSWSILQTAGTYAAKVAEFTGGWDNLAYTVVALKAVALGVGLITNIISMSPIGLLIRGIAFTAGLVIANWEQVKAWAAPYWDALAGFFTNGLDIIKRSLAFSPVGLMLNAWGPVTAWAVEFWQNLPEYFSRGWDAVKGALLSWSPLGIVARQWSAVLDFMSGMPDKFQDIGGYIIDGISDGIDSRIESVKQKILSLSEMLPDWLREKLDIHSPSRVFAQIGGHISEGIGVGIAAQQAAALAPLKGLARTLPAVLPATLGVGIATTAAAAPDLPDITGKIQYQAERARTIHDEVVPRIRHGQTTGTAEARTGLTAAGGAQGDTITINAEINVYAQPGQSADDIAAAVRAELQKIHTSEQARRRSRLIDE